MMVNDTQTKDHWGDSSWVFLSWRKVTDIANSVSFPLASALKADMVPGALIAILQLNYWQKEDEKETCKDGWQCRETGRESSSWWHRWINASNHPPLDLRDKNIFLPRWVIVSLDSVPSSRKHSYLMLSSWEHFLRQKWFTKIKNDFWRRAMWFQLHFDSKVKNEVEGWIVTGLISKVEMTIMQTINNEVAVAMRMGGGRQRPESTCRENA